MSPSEIRVCLDIGSQQHQVIIGLSTGTILEEFVIAHTPTGMENLFQRIDTYAKEYQVPVTVAMEAFNGHARPLDRYILAKNYRLFSINNLKLARFKEIFPGAAKSDRIDTRKMFELFQLKETLPLAKDVLQEVKTIPEANDQLKRLTRRREVLIEEKTQILCRMFSDLNAVAPGLASITKSLKNQWFLNFLTARPKLSQLAKLREKSLMKIPCLGKKYFGVIQAWQKEAQFSPEVEWVGEMILRDAKRVQELMSEIKILEEKLELLCQQSAIAQRLSGIPGFGLISQATLAGEIGIIDRFSNEASLALYLGMAPLTHSSGQFQGTRVCKHVNQRAKTILTTAMGRHVMCLPEAKMYYLKKRKEGKKHNQAARALGRHMVRVIFSMLKHQRDYWLPQHKTAH